jgi:hypothetical protein
VREQSERDELHFVVIGQSATREVPPPAFQFAGDDSLLPGTNGIAFAGRPLDFQPLIGL